MSSQRIPDGPRVVGYRLEQRLGLGGGGEVYHARCVRTGRAVALKLLRDPRSLASIQRASTVRHPNLVHILESGGDASGAYVAMERLHGTSLREVLARHGRLDVTAAVAVVLPVLAGLQAAHAAEIVHGDLTPDNVFLEGLDGGGARVKLLDLGGMPAAYGGDEVFGSAAYLSPEQATGEPVDARSDVFGVGLLLFELVTGRPAFEGPGPVAIAYAIVHREAPRVGDERLQPVLDAALAKSPGDRFPDAAALAAALAMLAPDAALSGEVLSGLARP